MIKLPETEEEMIAIINEWIEDVEGHDSADRGEMLPCAFDVWSILDFMNSKSTKELEVMSIDWSKAPDGCVGYSVSSINNHYWILDCGQKEAPDFGFTEFKFHPRPQPKPVFTQTMADSGELPLIGSKVQFVGNDDYLVEFSIVDGDEIECICHTTDFEGESIGVYRHKDGYSVSILTQLVKPITPPIELIDGKAYQFDVRDKGGIVNGIYNDYDKKLHVGQDHYFDLMSATNIQPLTVEVK